MKSKFLAGCSVLTLAVGVVAFGNAASASPFSYSSYSVTDQVNTTVTGGSPAVSEGGGMGQIVLHGAIDVAVFCLDIYHDLAPSGTFNEGPLTVGGSGSPNPTLTSTEINQIGSLIDHGTQQIGSVSDAAHNASAATQLAIWEIEYAGVSPSVNFSPYGGDDTRFNAVQALATTYCDYAQIGSSGDSARIGSSGDYAQIGSSGDYARIGSSGDYARIVAAGNGAIIAIAGFNAQFKVGPNGAVSAPYRDAAGRARFVIGYEGENLKCDVWYRVNDAGQFEEVETGEPVEVE